MTGAKSSQSFRRLVMTMEEMIAKGFVRRAEALVGYADDCKDAKTIKILCIAEPIIRSYDGAIQNEVDE
jgi:hypothetical protein